MIKPTSPRRRIIRRALEGLVSVLLTASVAAVTNDDFREFLGDSKFALIAYAAIVPAILAAQKAWRERRSTQ